MKLAAVTIVVFATLYLLAADVVVRLGWNKPEQADGLAGYNIHAGTNSRFAVTNAAVYFKRESTTNLSGSVTVTVPPRWYFAVTAENIYGMESDYSEELVWPVMLPPRVVGSNYVALTPRIERSTNLMAWEPMAMEPTLVPATNTSEFFRPGGLSIGPVKVPGQREQ